MEGCFGCFGNEKEKSLKSKTKENEYIEINEKEMREN